jgi:ATP-dependent helicase HrpA
MGQTTLPIETKKGLIQKIVLENSVTIITAATGAGKSTKAPMYIAEVVVPQGGEVICTQPRVLAARSVSARVAEEDGSELGRFVGYRTGSERKDSAETRLLYCTDGLMLVRALTQGMKPGSVLIIDEVHEYNQNIEELLAWAYQELQAGAPWKLVLMSATIEAEKLSQFFGGAPIIDVEGRLYPVEEQKPGPDMVTDIVRLLGESRNVLVFLPGKKEIDETMRAVQRRGVTAKLLPLHGELEPEEQARCFKHYQEGKCVFSTNVAQTSVTIDDIDAVVDSGKERRVRLVNGFEGLYLQIISKADSMQRRGRAGRTKPGIYINGAGVPWEQQPDFPSPEIMNRRLDKTVARFAKAGLDAEKMRFFHQPRVERFQQARKDLVKLGCLTEDGTVTKVGELVAKLPVSVEFGRMVAEAVEIGHKPTIQAVVSMTAILEVGGVTARNGSDWKPLTGDERGSDIIAQYRVYEAARAMLKNKQKSKIHESGVMLKAFFQTQQRRRDLADALKRANVKLGEEAAEPFNRDHVMRCIHAGLVRFLHQQDSRDYKDKHGNRRELAKESVCSGSRFEFALGLPMDIEIQGRRGTFILPLMKMVTKADVKLLCQVAPHLVRKDAGLFPRTTSEGGRVSTTRTYFNGLLVSEEEQPEQDVDAPA